MTNDEFEKLAREAAEKYSDYNQNEKYEGLNIITHDQYVGFIAGATWSREQSQGEISGIRHEMRMQVSAVRDRDAAIKERDELKVELKIQDDANDILTRQVEEMGAEVTRLRGELHYRGCEQDTEKIAIMPRKELNAEVRHCWREQAQMAKIIQSLASEVERLKAEIEELERTEQVYQMNRNWIEDAKVKLQEDLEIMMKTAQERDELKAEVGRLKGELAKWPNNALQRTLNRTSEELQSEKAKSLKYREAFRQHLDVMDSINSHLGYPFSQPLINAQKKLKALEGK